MLILTRRVGSKIMIGDDIVITVLGIQGMQARIGIDAPKDTKILREELIERSKEELFINHKQEI